MDTLKVAVVQTSPIAGDTAGTVKKVCGLIADCGSDGAKIAVFPEAFIGGYPKGATFDIHIGSRTPEGRAEYEAYWSRAIEVPGKETDEIAKAAKAANLYVVVGVIERDGGTLYCTALFFGPEGELLGKHRKLMPTGAERLCWGFGDGSTLTVVDTPWGKMGSVICWENYMPMMRMAMYSKGVTIYCAPTADDRDTWVSTIQHIALEGRCFVLSACQHMTGKDFPEEMRNKISSDKDEVLMRGGSCIVSPLGQILAGPIFNEDAILTAELDLSDVAKGKFDFDVRGHYARPDIFRLLVDEEPKPPVEVRR
jgi:nitrilase